MSQRRRITVAFQLTEDPAMKVFRHAWNRMSVDDIMAEPRRVRLDVFWCAADKPDRERLAPVYVGTKVPEDARCETCGIGICELQASMAEALEEARERARRS